MATGKSETSDAQREIQRRISQASQSILLGRRVYGLISMQRREVKEIRIVRMLKKGFRQIVH